MDLPVLPLSLEEGLARYKASKVQPKGFNLFCSMSTGTTSGICTPALSE